MATTTNFGWETPDDTDLVKDGAAAIRTLGSAIDTSFLDLKGGTTNQVLAKNSNTDLDFKWVADATGIPATIIDAKGDLIAGTAADTAGRLAVGTNGQYLSADSAETTGLKWVTPSSGGMTLLDSGTLSGASVTTATLSGAYVNLYVQIENLLPATDGTSLRMRYNGDSNTRYEFGTQAFSAAVTFANTEIYLTTAMDNVTQNGIVACEIYNYAGNTWKLCEYSGFANDTTTATNFSIRRGYGYYNQTTAITSLNFSMASGNMTSGTYKVYGVK